MDGGGFGKGKPLKKRTPGVLLTNERLNGVIAAGVNKSLIRDFITYFRMHKRPGALLSLPPNELDAFTPVKYEAPC